MRIPKGTHDMGVASLGNKVFFAGLHGNNFGTYDRVEIYDASNNTWSIANLSLPRTMISAASIGNKIFFAGGLSSAPTTRIDIFDESTQTWSTSELSTPKYEIITATAGSKLLFDCGDGNPNRAVDIYDNATQSWSATNVNFPGPPRFQPTATLGNIAFFFVYTHQVNIYNGATKLWSTAQLIPAIPYGHKAAIAIGNEIYLAGGLDNVATDQVWRVQF